MNKNFKWKVLIILFVIVGSVWAAYPPQQKISLGLDLKGGIHLLLQIETGKIPEKQRDGAVDRAVEIIRNRIDQFGVKEPVIIKQGKDQIIVQLPGLTDEDRAKDIVSKTAHLEFKLVSDDDKLLREAIAATKPPAPKPAVKEGAAEKKLEESLAVKPDTDKKETALAEIKKEEALVLPPPVVPAGFELKEIEGDDSRHLGQTLLLEKEPILTGEHLTNATVGFDQYGQAVVEFELDKEGAKTFDDVTFRNIGKRIAIVLDGKVNSAPVIRDRIPNGKGQISGSFTSAQASDLALTLRAGALPAPVRVVEQRVVGPSLGRDSIQKGITASIGGAVLVILFMVGYYRLSGFIASIAVVLNLVILLGLLALFKASLSLPGIAGIILTMGMAVDANVLINERMREEMKLGKAIRSIISAGYHKAFSAIFDSNLTTILAAGILLWFGAGPIRGFSVTLTLGLVASFFTALFVTRVIFDFLTQGQKQISLHMVKLFDNLKVDWVSKRAFGYVVSSVMVAIGIYAMVTLGNQHLGIDFTGGTLQEIHLKTTPDLGKIRSALEKSGVSNAQLQGYGNPGDNNIIVRSKGEDKEKIKSGLTEAVGTGNFEIRRSDNLGPTAGKELFGKAVKSIVLALLAMLIFMWYRYNLRFAVCATIMICHDIFSSIGIYALTGREFSLQTLAAVLTIIGYSINDTIIVYDRVRENMKLMRKASMADILNLSMNQTFMRSVLTTTTTMLVVLSLFFFGGPALNDFAFILLIGFSLGVYSTIFVAAPLIVDSSPKK